MTEAGASGAGKSTLINAISGSKILTRVGEGSTERIDVYESDTWPFKFIDTKGFEYSHRAQKKTVKQIREYTRKKENRNRMILEQKRFTANRMVGAASATAAAIGAVPFTFAPDAAVLVPLETLLTKKILKVYNVKFSGELVSAIVGSAAITNIAKALITPLKALPIAGSVINGVVAGVIVLALGGAEIALGEAIYTGKVNPSRIEEVVRYTEEKLSKSPLVGEVVTYLQENAESLTGKDSKQIIAIIRRLLTKRLLK